MDITQLRYFLEVAESQHITASAEKLHIAQPALSRSIHKLEQSMGVKLFESKGRNIVLTECGKYLKENLIPIFEQLDSFPEILQAIAKLNGETIHLNVLAASTVITDAIIEYKKECENVNFQLLQNTENEVFDIEITTKFSDGRKQTAKPNQFICNETIFLAVPNNEKYINRSTITLKEAEREGFISLIGSRQFRSICDRICRNAGISPRIIFESDNPAAVKNMIAANMGVGFWPEFSWGRISNENIKLLEISDPKCSRDVIITYKCNKEKPENAADFFEFLKNFLAKEKKFSESRKKRQKCHL